MITASLIGAAFGIYLRYLAYRRRRELTTSQLARYTAYRP